MKKTALILLDFQNGILDSHFQDQKADYLSRASTTINKARQVGIHIIHVKTSFRPGHPDISKRNRMLAQVVANGVFVEGDATVAIAQEVTPAEHDIVVTKRRVSAFSGSDLDIVLRSLEVDTLILAGVATSGAVLSTACQAADLDFHLIILGDLCLDPDDEVHRVLVEKVFPRQGRTLSVEEWLKEIN
ncbi:hypothetical protein SLS62_008804 [Diatrype stigma]|uniref:Isochorismatase-like domain-containing protein n=1 Tax=Diatrype stigma TaxID=117547 RepID=A0AAN9UIL6_9PEZI